MFSIKNSILKVILFGTFRKNLTAINNLGTFQSYIPVTILLYLISNKINQDIHGPASPRQSSPNLLPYPHRVGPLSQS